MITTKADIIEMLEVDIKSRTKAINRLERWLKQERDKREELLREHWLTVMDMEIGDMISFRKQGRHEAWDIGELIGFGFRGAGIFPRIQVGDEIKSIYGQVRKV